MLSHSYQRYKSNMPRRHYLGRNHVSGQPDRLKVKMDHAHCRMSEFSFEGLSSGTYHLADAKAQSCIPSSGHSVAVIGALRYLSPRQSTAPMSAFAGVELSCVAPNGTLGSEAPHSAKIDDRHDNQHRVDQSSGTSSALTYQLYSLPGFLRAGAVRRTSTCRNVATTGPNTQSDLQTKEHGRTSVLSWLLLYTILVVSACHGDVLVRLINGEAVAS